MLTPSGTERSVTLSQVSEGLFRGKLPAEGFGAYRFQQGDVSTITAIGALNPKEYSELFPTTEVLSPLIERTDGFIETVGLGNETLPQLRRVDLKADASGESWMGLRSYKDYTVTRSQRQPLVHPLLFFSLFFLSLAVAWWREGL